MILLQKTGRDTAGCRVSAMADIPGYGMAGDWGGRWVSRKALTAARKA